MILTVNEKEYKVAAEDQNLSLVEWLREKADLTGTKTGCNIGRCGSCTVLVNDKPRLACKVSVSEVAGSAVTTIEGFPGTEDSLHPLQQSFIDSGAIQCGYCTPGMVLRAHAFLLRTPNPARSDIRRAISPNLCRCTGYQQIIDAVESASQFYKER